MQEEVNGIPVMPFDFCPRHSTDIYTGAIYSSM